MSGPVRPPLTVAESDGTPTIRPCNTIAFNSADFVVIDNGTTARIDLVPGGGGGASLADTLIGFGDAAGLLTGSANFTFTEESGGSGPAVLLTGDKPVMRFTDDTGATNYTMRFTQSGSSFYMAHEDSAGTDNGMLRISASYVALQPTIQPRVGIGGYGSSGVALHIVDDGTDDMLRIESTDAGAASSPKIDLFRNSASPADADNLGTIHWSFQDDGGGKNDAGYIKAYLADATAGSEDGDFYWYATSNGTAYNMISIRGGIRAVEVNVNNSDVDFIANGDTVAELLHVDASDDSVGVGGMPDANTARLQVTDDGSKSFTLMLESTDDDANVGPTLALWRNSPSPADSDVVGAIDFRFENDAGSRHEGGLIEVRLADITGATEDTRMFFKNLKAGTLIQTLTLKESEVVINDEQRDVNFRCESNSNAEMLRVDAGLDRVFIGAAGVSGGATLQVPDNTISSYKYLTNVSGTSPVTLTNDDMQSKLYVHNDAAAHTWVLPAGVKGMYMKFVSTGGSITITPTGADTINGVNASVTRTVDNQVYEVICFDAGKWIVSNP